MYTLSIHDGGVPHITNGNQGAIRASFRARLQMTQDEITEKIQELETSRVGQMTGRLKGRRNGLYWTLRKN